MDHTEAQRHGGGTDMSELDMRHFWPKVLQVLPTDSFEVYAYLNDGSVRQERKKLINRLSKVMTAKVNNAVNNTMEKVFRDFMK